MPPKKAILLLAALALVGLASLLTVHLADRGTSADRAIGQRLDGAARSSVGTASSAPASSAPASPAAVPATASSAAATPQPCIQLPAHEAFLCVSANAFQTKDGAVYW